MKNIKLNQLSERVLLAGKEALSVEHNGKLLGYFYPVTQDELEMDAVWDRLDKAVEKAVAESGMDRETLIDTLDPSKPFPFEDKSHNIADSSEIKTAQSQRES